jgi:hypothetical protein
MLVDKTVRTWDLTFATQLSCLRIDDPGVWKSGHSKEGEYIIHGVSGVGFTSDGQHIVTLSKSGVPFLSEVYTGRVWDERNGVCIRTLRGKGGFKALCSGAPWQAVIHGPEVEISSSKAGRVVGWFPATLKSLVANPSGRSWAGSFDRRLYHFVLEGEE